MKPDPTEIALKTVVNARKILRVGLLLAVGLFLSACQEKAKVGKVEGPTVVYTLVTVNGAKVPATVSHDGAKLEARSGTFTINADGTCRSKMVFVPPSGAESTHEAKATYTREGSQLNLQWEGAGKTTGTVEGDTFTMDNEGMVLAYRK